MDVDAVDFAGLYVAERNRLRRLIDRIVRNRTATDDILHDAFVKLMGPTALAGVINDRAYLVRIVQDLAIDHQRQQKKFVSLQDADIFGLADPAPNAEAALVHRQALKLTLLVIAEMPEKTRRAFAMHRLGEKTLAQIARELNLSTAQVGRLVMMGYTIVRDKLREQSCK